MTLDFLGEVNIVTTDLDKDRSFPHNKQQPEGQAHFQTLRSARKHNCVFLLLLYFHQERGEYKLQILLESMTQCRTLD